MHGRALIGVPFDTGASGGVRYRQPGDAHRPTAPITVGGVGGIEIEAQITTDDAGEILMEPPEGLDPVAEQEILVPGLPAAEAGITYYMDRETCSLVIMPEEYNAEMQEIISRPGNVRIDC